MFKAVTPFGLVRTTSLVIGNVIGTSILLLPAVLAKYGSVSLIGWAFTSLGALLLAHVFSRLSQRIPKAGGPYVYSRHVFGDFIGFQMAWSYWIANWVSNAAVAIAFVNFLGWFWPAILKSSILSLAASLSTLWFLTLINSLSFKSVGNLQVITTCIKILPLAAIAIFGSFHIDISYFSWHIPFQNMSVFNAVGAAAAATLFSFVGLETATVPAGIVENPEKTIPRATMIGTFISAILYIWTCFVIFGVLSPEKAAFSTSPFSDVGAIIFGPTAEKIIAACAVVSCFGTLNGWILLQGQVPYAAAQDQLFPKIFARLSKKGLPVFGLVFSSLLISLLLILNYETNLVEQFNFIITLTTFAILQPYLYSSAAELYLLLQETKGWKTGCFFKNIFITFLAIFYALWAITGAGETIVYLGSFLIFGSIPIYVLMKKNLRT